MIKPLRLRIRKKVDGRSLLSEWMRNVFFFVKKNLLILAIVIIFFVGVILTAFSPLFSIKKISVVGNNFYSSDEIINASDISVGNNAFKILSKSFSGLILMRFIKAERSVLNRCCYISKVKAKYLMPGEVQIEVIERQPIASIKAAGTEVYLDEEGRVLDHGEQSLKMPLPIIVGIEFDRFELGRKLDTNNEEGLLQALDIIKSIKQSDETDKQMLAEKVKTIDISDRLNIKLIFEQRIVVNIGSIKDIMYKITYMKQILFHSLKEDEKGYLDFTVGENPVLKPFD